MKLYRIVMRLACLFVDIGESLARLSTRMEVYRL